MPQRNCRARRSCRYTPAQERQAVETHQRRGHRSERGRQCLAISGAGHLATMERIPPPEPRRDNPLMVCKQTTAGQRMNCIKLLGQSLMARDFDRQVAEIQVRVAVLNRYTALGIPITEAVG